jgi:anti-sigma factor RsiW
MSDCDKFRPNIMAALLDRELGFEESVAVEEHVQTCEACKRVVEAYVALQDAAAMATVPQTVDLWSRISKELEADSESSMIEEIRIMRQEMKALRDEVAGLRRELAQSKSPQFPRSTILSVPDAPTPSYKQYRLV